MDPRFLSHPSFLFLVAAQAGMAICLLAGSELIHHRVLVRGGDPVKTRRSRKICRITLMLLFCIGVAAYSIPGYHPLMGERSLREALSAVERDDSAAARKEFGRAIHHLTQVRRTVQAGGLWGGLVKRFVNSWGGPAAVSSALGTAYFVLGDCRKATPFVESELRRRPSATRTALLSYRLAVCHLRQNRTGEAEDALLRALLIDRRYAYQARKDPRLKAMAEELLSKRL